tara:strand:- start:59002 stop:60021 length:1020 start_codon:yes stop_codon:yes gene_type:complete
MEEILQLIDSAIFDDINALYNNMKAMGGAFLVHARSLVALLMVMYFAVKGYGIMVGDSDVEILPLVRPFALLFIILFWGQFVNLLELPLKIIEQTGEGITENTIDDTNALFQRREIAYERLVARINSDADRLEREVEKTEDNAIWEMVIGNALEILELRMQAIQVMITAKLKYLMFSIIEWIVFAFFKACMYFVFFLKALIGGILVALGPFAFAISVIPGFRDAYLKWISRFVGVLLYGLLGHLAINTAMLFVNGALTREIGVLNAIIDGPRSAFVAYTTMPNFSETALVVSMLVGAFGMLCIPIISSWVISMGSSSGVGGRALNSAKKIGSAAVGKII